MNQEEISKLLPENQLKIWLIQNGFPDKEIPKILKFCPQLIHKFTIEQIAMACLTDIKKFTPEKMTIMLSPVVYQAAQKEIGQCRVTPFIEEAIAICCADSIETYMTNFITKLQKPFKD